MRRWFAVFGLALAFAAFALPARAEKRVALVIGDSAYRNLPDQQQLRNAVNDARAMKAALEALHFDVDIGENLDRAAFIDKLSDFGARLERDDIAFFFYAGHGVSFNGANYLLPSDIPAPQATGRDEEDRLADQSIAEMRVLERIRKSGARLAVVVLDACRDNPLKDASDRSIGDQRGLEPPPPVHGVLEIYSAGPGQTALDGSGDTNSVFTKAFVGKLRTPGLGLRDLAYKTQAEVFRIAAARGHDQFPVVSSQIISDEDIYLAGRPAAEPKPAADEGAAAAVQQEFAAAMAADTTQALDRFAADHPTSPLADIARRESRRLGPLAAVKPQPVVVPAPAGPCGGVTSVSLAARGVGVLSANEACALKPGDAFKECADCPEMVVIPEGSFTMGSPDNEPGRYPNEGPLHMVKFARPFAVGKFDVTKDEFAAFARETGYDAGSECSKDAKWEETTGLSWQDPGFQQSGSHPVACVNWNDAQAYMKWLSDKTNQTYRLLSESEWEYSARAGKTTAYFWGDAVGKNYANCDGCGGRWDNKQTSPVGSFAPNAFGLYDMHGNVWQWVEDCYRDSYTGAPDDGSPVTGECSRRALRGGAWNCYPGLLRAADRYWNLPPARSGLVGFRVARTLPL